DVAVIGLSKARDRVFHGLALQERLREKEANARCGVWVVELRTGRLLHWLEFTDLIVELYDVVALPGAVRPMALGFRGDDLRRVVSFRAGDRLRVDWPHTLPVTTSRAHGV